MEKAAEVVTKNGLTSAKAIRRMVESFTVQADETQAGQGRNELTQEHPLIRAGEDYGAFWKQHAARAAAPEQALGGAVSSAGSAIVSWDNLAIKIDLRRYLRADHPELQRRAIDTGTCRYLGCGFLPRRAQGKSGSPLNGRLVFQIRGGRENGKQIIPVILSHTGRALSTEQQGREGKYWSYPFRKGLEIYNQDRLVLDEEARGQCEKFGMILVEGFFDVARLVAAGCRNVGALMGSSISAEQIQRLLWIHNRLQFPYIVLLLDRDKARTASRRRDTAATRPLQAGRNGV